MSPAAILENASLGHCSLSLRLPDSLVKAYYVSSGMHSLGGAPMTRHAGGVQDTETGPAPVVADQIYIYRDPTCTNKAVSKLPAWTCRTRHIWCPCR